jgi:hypothetical protein
LYLKGPCHKIFDLWFFHQTALAWFLIHGLESCRVIQIRIRRYIRKIGFFVVSCVNDTAHHWSAVSVIPPTRLQIRTIFTRSGSKFRKIRFQVRPQSNIIPQRHYGPVMGSVNDTAGLSWAVSMTLHVQLYKLCTITWRCH